MIRSHHRIPFLLAAVLVMMAGAMTAGGGFAQTNPPDPPPSLSDPGTAPNEMERGFDMFREGADAMLRGIFGEVGPALRALADRIGDLRNYESPEVQENGDILIRRKPDAPPYVPPPADPAAPTKPGVDL